MLRRSLIACSLIALTVAIILPLTARAQQAPQSSSLQGRVLDFQGKPVAGALLKLQFRDAGQVATSETDAQGDYVFPNVHEGVYTLHAAKQGYADAEIQSIFVGAGEAKAVDLTLNRAPDSAKPAAGSLQFFDEPRFTVAGVTDTTSLGGHGSDTIVRARENIAKETVSLGSASAQPAPVSAGNEQELRGKVEREPNNCDANHRLGRLLIDEGKPREAIPFLAHASQLSPSDDQVAYDLALANAAAGNYERARDQANSLLASRDTAGLHHLLGNLDEKLSDPLEAVRQYQRAAEIEPSEQNFLDWGSELLLHHAPEPALSVFTEGSRLFPRSSRLLIGIGAAWFARGDYDNAVRNLSAAADLNPDDPAPYLFLGKIAHAETRPSPAVAEKLQRFVDAHPRNAEASYYCADALWKLRDLQKDDALPARVESLLKSAVSLDPKLAPAYLQLGIVHSARGDSRAAISNYLSALQIDPGMEEAHYRLAQAYRQTGEDEKSKEELRLYQKLARESAEQADRERHEIRQFVYSLTEPPAAPSPK